MLTTTTTGDKRHARHQLCVDRGSTTTSPARLGNAQRALQSDKWSEINNTPSMRCPARLARINVRRRTRSLNLQLRFGLQDREQVDVRPSYGRKAEVTSVLEAKLWDHASRELMGPLLPFPSYGVKVWAPTRKRPPPKPAVRGNADRHAARRKESALQTTPYATSPRPVIKGRRWRNISTARCRQFRQPLHGKAVQF